MRFLTILFSLAGLALLIFNIRVTVLVLRSPIYTPLQKMLQILLTWLVPFVGAVITHHVHSGKEWKRGEAMASGETPPGIDGSGMSIHGGGGG